MEIAFEKADKQTATTQPWSVFKLTKLGRRPSTLLLDLSPSDLHIPSLTSSFTKRETDMNKQNVGRFSSSNLNIIDMADAESVGYIIHNDLTWQFFLD